MVDPPNRWAKLFAKPERVRSARGGRRDCSAGAAGSSWTTRCMSRYYADAKMMEIGEGTSEATGGDRKGIGCYRPRYQVPGARGGHDQHNDLREAREPDDRDLIEY